ncbi:hypothetical protein NPIL_583901, partial [Nephila pilipes]
LISPPPEISHEGVRRRSPSPAPKGGAQRG